MDEEDGSLERHSRESLVYLMYGHLVEAHLKNGSVYSGRFHAADLQKDSGIVLKMASLIKDGTLGGHRSGSEVVRKPPMDTFFIPADELVQVVAKDLSVFSSEGKLNAVQSEKSVSSKSCRVDQRREVNPWGPDGEAPEGLDTVFDKSSKSGGWNQFKANEELSGVKSTFKEDMYTTTLDKGSLTRELDEKALRIAGEIVDENDRLTFGMKQMAFSGKGYGGESQPFQNETNVDQSCSISDDHAGHLPSEQRSKDFPAQGSSASESQLGERRNNNDPEVAHSDRTPKGSVSGSTPSTSTRTGLSPSSSSSSLPSSEKFMLNPNAKEFKPSQPPAPIRPQSPIAGGSFYYAAPPPPVQLMALVPAGYGIPPQYPGQRQLLRYPGHEYPQTYYPPNAPPHYRQWHQLMMELQEEQQARPPNMDYLPLPPP